MMERYYAIKKKKDGKLITGTAFGHPCRQLTDNGSPPLLIPGYRLKTELKRRHINLKNYKVVQVRVYVEYELRNREIEERVEEGWNVLRERGRNHGRKSRTEETGRSHG